MGRKHAEGEKEMSDSVDVELDIIELSDEDLERIVKFVNDLWNARERERK